MITGEEFITAPDVGTDAPEMQPDLLSEAEEEAGEGLHLKHRRRLRRKAYPRPDALDEVRLMELMLFEPLPRCDTNDMAKTLLERCGGMRNFVDGTPEALAAMAELGGNTAVYLEALSLLCRRYEKTILADAPQFDTLRQAREWIRIAALPVTGAELLALSLDNELKTVCMQAYAAYELQEPKEAAKKITMDAVSDASAYLFLAITHPNGLLQPSRDEVNMLLTLSDVCLPKKTYLAEAVIVTEDDARYLSEVPIFPDGTFLPFRT